MRVDLNSQLPYIIILLMLLFSFALLILYSCSQTGSDYNYVLYGIYILNYYPMYLLFLQNMIIIIVSFFGSSALNHNIEQACVP